MGFLDNFIEKRSAKRKAKAYQTVIKTLYGNDLRWFITNYAENMYSIPEVRTAIEKIAEIFSTIPIYHKIVYPDGYVKYEKLNDNINYVLSLKPSPLQNATAFWQNCVTRLLLKNNLFIEPIYDTDGQLVQLYPLPYSRFNFELNKDNATVEFLDKNGSATKYDLDDLIYLSRFCNLSGGAPNSLGLYETVIQALASKIVNVCDPNKPIAILTGKLAGQGQLKDEDKVGVMNKLQTYMDENVNGIMYLDDKWQINPVNWRENDVNRDLMEFITDTVYKYFGISKNIINGTASDVEIEEFIANFIKPLAKQFEEELTYKLFTKREVEVGHRIEFDVFALSISSLSSKTNLFSIASRNGILSIDEMREMLGQPPLANGLGRKHRVSVDCVDIELADKYQLAKYDVNNLDTEETENELNKNFDEDLNADNKEVYDD